MLNRMSPDVDPDETDPESPDVPEPREPHPSEPGDNKTLNSPINELESRLFLQRKVLVFGAINDKLARDVTGDTIHDMIRFVDADVPVRVIGTGWVASAGALIYVAGKKERRFCLPHTRFLIHQPMGGVRGPATDIGIEAREIVKMRERLNRLIAKECGQTFEKVEADSDRNYWMSAEEAIEYGMVSRVIHSAKDLSQ